MAKKKLTFDDVDKAVKKNSSSDVSSKSKKLTFKDVDDFISGGGSIGSSNRTSIYNGVIDYYDEEREKKAQQRLLDATLGRGAYATTSSRTTGSTSSSSSAMADAINRLKGTTNSSSAVRTANTNKIIRNNLTTLSNAVNAVNTQPTGVKVSLSPVKSKQTQVPAQIEALKTQKAQLEAEEVRLYENSTGSAQETERAQKLADQISAIEKQIYDLSTSYSNKNIVNRYINTATAANDYLTLAHQGAQRTSDVSTRRGNDISAANARKSAAAGVVVDPNELKSSVFAPGTSMYSVMTEDELNTYYYLLEKDSNAGTSQAQDFLNALTPELQQRFVNSANESASEYATGTGLKPVNAWLYRTAGNLTSGAEYVGSIIDEATGGKTKFSASPSAAKEARAITQAQTEKLNEVSPALGYAYSIGSSIVDSVIGQGVGLVTGSEAMSLLTMSGSAAYNAYADAKEAGADDTTALVVGGFSGIFESLFEKVSLDSVIKMSNSAERNALIKNLLKQMGIEGSEEMATEIANIISEMLIMKDKSSNKDKSIGELAMQVLESGVAGAISGGIMGSVGTAVQSRNYNKAGKAIKATSATHSQNVGNAVIDDAMLSTEPALKKLAEQAAADKENVSDRTLGKLASGLEEAGWYAPNTNRAAIINKLEDTTKELVKQENDGNGTIFDAVDKETKKSVEINGVTVESGVVLAQDSEGNEYALSSLTFADDTQEAVLSEAQKLVEAGVLTNKAQAEAFVTNFTGTEEQVSNYAAGFKSVVQSAEAGLTEAQVKSSSMLAREYLTDSQIHAAFKSADVYDLTHVTGKTTYSVGLNKAYQDSELTPSQRSTLEENDAQVQMVDSLAKEYGMKIVMVPSLTKYKVNGNVYDTSANGFTVRSDGTIYIAADAQASAYTSVAMHEMTHAISAWNKTGYNDLRTVVQEALTEQGNDFDQMVSDAMERHGLSKDVAIEEVIANAVPNILADQDYVNKLYNTNRSLWQKIKDFIAKAIEALTGIQKQNRDYAASASLRENLDALKKISNAFDNAARIAGQNIAEGTASVNTHESVIVTGRDAIENETVIDDMNAVAAVDAEPAKVDAGIVIKKDGGVAFSPNTEDAWEKHMREAYGNTDSVETCIKFMRDLIKFIKDDPDLSAYMIRGDVPYSKTGPLRANVEYHITFDVDTMCQRAWYYANIRDTIVNKIGRSLTKRESRQLIDLIERTGGQIPCRYCYVEGKRILFSDSYLNYLKYRAAVMSYDNDADAMKAMYAYDAKKNALTTDGANNTFGKWRELKNSGKEFYNPSTPEEHYVELNKVKNAIYDFLEEKYGKLYQSRTDSLGNTYSRFNLKNGGTNTNAYATMAKAALKSLGYNVDLKDNSANIGFVENKIVIPWVTAKREGYEVGRFSSEKVDKKTFNPEVITLERLANGYAASASSAHMFEPYQPYVDQLSNVSQDVIEAVIAMGGVRIHSSNDAQLRNIVDYMQFFSEMAEMGLTSHSYTKNLVFAELAGRLGGRVNVSIALNGDFKTGIQENINEGVSWKDARELQKKNRNVGVMAMVTNDDQLSFVLNTPWIKMTIPFHSSGMESEYSDSLRWVSYQSIQNEKYPSDGDMKAAIAKAGRDVPDKINTTDLKKLYAEATGKSIILDKDGKVKTPHFFPEDSVVVGVNGTKQVVPGHHNDAALYFKLCEQYGVKPRFADAMVEDVDGNKIHATEHPEYVKLIEETARTDNEQTPISMDALKDESFKEWLFGVIKRDVPTEKRSSVGFESNDNSAQLVIQKFISEYVNNPEAKTLEYGKLPTSMRELFEDEIVVDYYSGNHEEFSTKFSKNDPVRGVDYSVVKGQNKLATPTEKMLKRIEARNAGIAIEEPDAGLEQSLVEGNGYSDISMSRKVDDYSIVEKLDNTKHIKVYRAMQVIDGHLYPPMAAVVDGNREDYSELGKWEMAVEHPELIEFDKNGKPLFKLDKGNGTSLYAAYNPYMHASNVVLNDQFSGAWTRPNLVTVECVVPVSEENGAYYAKYAKDSTGWHDWHSGVVASALRAATAQEFNRQVFLSRYIKPVRILSNDEVAQQYKELLKGTDVGVPQNVVSPYLYEALKKAGVKTIPVDERSAAVVAEEKGYNILAYHATDSDFYTFKRSELGKNTFGNATDFAAAGTSLLGYWFHDSDISEKTGNDTSKTKTVYLKIEHPYYATLEELSASIEGYSSNADKAQIAYENQKYAMTKKASKAFVDDLMSDGYDGIIVDDTEFGGTSYVVFNSSQAKLADDMTFDDKGNVIKMDKRFNPDKQDIRFSSKDYDLQIKDATVAAQAARDEYDQARQQYMSLTQSKEYRTLMEDIKSVSFDRMDEVIQKISEYEKNTGLGELSARIKELEEKRSQTSHVLNKLIEQRDIQKQNDDIEASGLSESVFMKNAAVKEFGYTPYYYDAGYMLQNGKLLNFSGEKGRHFGSRGQDHRAIGAIFAGSSSTASAAMTRFMNYGNIRVMDESPGIEISTNVEPTSEQYVAIRKYADACRKKEFFNVDFSDEYGNNVNTLGYEDSFTGNQVVNSIKKFFQTGEAAQQSVVSQFHTDDLRFSLKDSTPADAKKLAAENSKLKEALYYANRELSETYGKDVDHRQIERLANVVLRETNSAMRKDTLTEDLYMIFQEIAQNGSTQYAIANATEVGIGLMENVLKKTKDYSMLDIPEVKEMSNYLKSTPITLTDEQRDDAVSISGSLSAFKKHFTGSAVRFTNDGGASVDEVLATASAKWDWLVNGNNSDPLINLMQLADITAPMYVSKEGYDLELAAANQWLKAIQSYGKIMDKSATFADKMQAKLTRVRSEYEKKLSDAKYQMAAQQVNADIKNKELRDRVAQVRATYIARNIESAARRRESADVKKYRERIIANTKTILNKLETNKVQEYIRAPIAAFMREINISSESIQDTKKAKAWQERLMSLSAVMNQLDAANIDGMLLDLNSDFTTMVTEYIGSNIDTMYVGDMNVNQLRDLDHIVQIIKHAISTADQMFYGGKAVATRIKGEAGIEMYAERSGNWRRARAQKGLLKWLEYDNAKPVYLFDMLGGVFKEAYQDVLDGSYKAARDYMNAKEVYESIASEHHLNDWIDNYGDTLTINAGDGQEITLTRDLALAIYATNKREMTNKIQSHLRGGGILLEGEFRREGNGKLKHWVQDATGHPLSDYNIAEINEWLTDEQRDYADQIVKYMSTDLSKLGNETSLLMNGVKLFTEPYYFTVSSSDVYLKSKEPGQVGADGKQIQSKRLKNASYTKALTKGANNAIVIQPFRTVVGKHTANMCNYADLSIPQDNMFKLLNYRRSGDFRVEGEPVTMKQVLINAYGGAMVHYIDTLLADMSGSLVTDTRENEYTKWLSRFKKGAVLGNMSVAVQQPSAIARASAMINPKYFFGDVSNPVKLYDELMQYSGTAIIKEIGGFDVGTGRGAGEWIMNDLTQVDRNKVTRKLRKASERIDDVSGALPGLADKVTWANIWAACKREQEAELGLPVSNEKVLEAAGKRFDDIIEHTQVYDSVLARSSNMRSKSAHMQVLTAFMAEPTVSLNLLYRTATSDRKNFGRALGAFVSSVLLNAALRGVVSAFRDDDDEKTLWQKYLSSIKESILGSIPSYLKPKTGIGTAAASTAGFVLSSDLSPVGMIPYVKDVASIFSGYTVNRSDMNVWNDLFKAVQYVSSDKKSDYAKIRDIVGAVATIAGVPVKNVWRDVEAVGRTFIESWPSDKAGTSLYTNSYINDIADEALESGDYTELEKAKEARIESSTAKDPEKAFTNSGSTMYKDEYVEAVKSGDTEQADKIKSMLTETFGIASDKIDGWVIDSYRDDTYNAIDRAITGEKVEPTEINGYIKQLKKLGKTDSSLISSISGRYKEQYLDAFNSGDKSKANRIRNALKNLNLYDSKNHLYYTDDRFANWRDED